ncbi:DUF2490 domain-containing protein [Mangrovivirga cuniculi]|uniref:DUF2490 domain-containing protein n=1 Tax=Mangrovivirga cuniculi TaxID=2715131 RepID=A0A4D7JM69_9BACT|nr:DUF2490 domain-containing protein [Mangrovivirga cuniculi]QCK15747.1 DUF2490 domain-containing protein [Mangrovivirga cuniculi]
MRTVNKTYTSILILLLMFCSFPAFSQDNVLPEKSKIKEPTSIFWINTYGNIRLSKRLFWVAQTHFRFQEKGGTPMVGQIAQVYNRHALGYLFSKKFNVAVGGVLRINFNTSDVLESGEKSAVPEWRIWEQAQFAMPLGRSMIYHRFRFEQRWSKGYLEDSDYIYRNRWRYMFRMKIPINKPKLASNTFYIAPEAELIMQSGEPVIDSPLEDLRLHTSFGYIISPRLTMATGFLYSLGQELHNGGYYKQKMGLRFHVYFSPDFRKVKHKLPSIHKDD